MFIVFILIGVACINPPIPTNDTNLVRNYVEDTVIPFGDNTTYTCEPGHFFGIDKEMESYNLTCQTDGSFYWTGAWQKCFHPTERFCFDPPDPPYNGGQYDWNNVYEGSKTPYSTMVTYTCGLGRKLIKYTNNGTIQMDKQELTCQWDQTWYPATVMSSMSNQGTRKKIKH